jgi:hypothetical protein
MMMPHHFDASLWHRRFQMPMVEEEAGLLVTFHESSRPNRRTAVMIAAHQDQTLRHPSQPIYERSKLFPPHSPMNQIPIDNQRPGLVIGAQDRQAFFDRGISPDREQPAPFPHHCGEPIMHIRHRQPTLPLMNQRQPTVQHHL